MNTLKKKEKSNFSEYFGVIKDFFLKNTEHCICIFKKNNCKNINCFLFFFCIIPLQI